jgi:hypothetical protein
MNKQVTISRSTRRQFIKYGAMAAGAVVLNRPLSRARAKPQQQIKPGPDRLRRQRPATLILRRPPAKTSWLCATFRLRPPRHEKISPRQVRHRSHVYKDYRELLEKEKDLDAVDIAVPDHMHAVIAATAIKMGKHVYCQKPLTHDVFEARLARFGPRAQCGHANGQPGQRFGFLAPRGRSDARRHYWPCASSLCLDQPSHLAARMDRPPGSDPVPAGLDWDLWLGTAPERPFKRPGLARTAGVDHASVADQRLSAFRLARLAGFRHRRAGRHGLPHGQLALPLAQAGLSNGNRSQFLGHEYEMYPASSNIRFEFPAREGMPAVTLHWSDGGNKPPLEVTADVEATLGRFPTAAASWSGRTASSFRPTTATRN